MDVGYQGSRFYETPNIDALAERGLKFSQAYSAHPRCVPSRYALMTGKYPARTKSPGPGPRLNDSDFTMAEAFKTHGYTTFFAGKWHLSEGSSFPEDQGFDVNYGGGDSGVPKSYFYPYNVQKLGQGNERAPDIDKLPVPANGYHLTDQLTDLAIDFIAGDHDRPFFIYLSHYGVHTPFESKQDMLAAYSFKGKRMYMDEAGDDFSFDPWTGETKLRQDNPFYAGMIQSVDESFGRIVSALKKAGIYDNTILVFTSDHGGLSNRGGGRSVATSNIPLRAGKGHNYEGGIRTPLYVVWEGEIKGGWTSTPIIGTDYYPTLLELTGHKTFPDEHLDAVSFADLLKGKRMNSAERAFYWHSPRPRQKSTGDRASTAIRLGDYKLLDFFEHGVLELYDLRQDQSEQENLIEKKPAKAQELYAKLVAWRKSVDAFMTKKPVPSKQKPAPSKQQGAAGAG